LHYVLISVEIVSSGRCTFGYTLELRDGQCPTFHKLANTTNNATSEGAGGVKEDVFCSILARHEDKELCVDIAGENPAYRTPVLGYDCTGRWNQLFRLTENCTIQAEQPGFIGRVRGRGDQTIVSCLDARHESGVVLTAECEHLQSRTVGGNEQATNSSQNSTSSDGSSATVSVSVSGEGDGAGVQDAVQGAKSTAARWQQYEFLPASGAAYKAYMPSRSGSSEVEESGTEEIIGGALNL
jgi:hypothetical protein